MVVLAGVSIAGALGSGVLLTRRRRRRAPRTRIPQDVQVHFTELETKWRQTATMKPIVESVGDTLRAAPDAIATLQSRLDDAIVDDKHLLSETMRASLIDTLAAQLEARTHDEPDAYLSLIDADAVHRWITPKEWRFWGSIPFMLKRYFHKTVPDDEIDLRETFSLFWKRFMPASHAPLRVLEGSRFTRMGLGAWGARINTHLDRSDSLPTALTPDSPEWNYWMRTQRTAIADMFRVPKRRLGEAIAAHGGAVRAEVFMLIEPASGKMLVWYPHWFWDVQLQAWACESMQLRGLNYVFVPF